MGKTLLSRLIKFHITFFACLFLLMLGENEVHAQVEMGVVQPFELEFTSVSDLTQNTQWKINPADLPYLESLSFFLPNSGEGFELTESNGMGEEDGLFIYRQGLERSLAFRPGQDVNGTFISLPIENTTGKIIDQIQISFDFAYQKNGNRPVTLKLVNRLSRSPNNISVNEERIFDSATFGEVSEEWQTAGLNLLLENLFLEDGETFELEIQWNSNSGAGPADAFALQRIELDPVEVQYEQGLSPGDLTITEILPSFRTQNNRVLQYFEIYNKTLDQIDLRGMKIRSGDTEHVIRESVIIEPYGMIVVGNGTTGEDAIEVDYELQNLQIPSHGGMIDLMYNDTRIVRAAYDERRSEASFELRSVLAVDEGYISISEFQPSASRTQNQLNGSPGSPGATERAFTYIPDQDNSWQLLSAPGQLHHEMNSESSSRFYIQQENQDNMDTERIGRTLNVPPGTGFLVQRSGNSNQQTTRSLIASELTSQGELQAKMIPSQDGWAMLGNPYTQPLDLGQISPVNGEFASHVAQVWDPERHSFRLTTPGNRQIEPWQGFLIQNKDAESVRFQNNPDQREIDEPESNIQGRDRYIAFELQGTGNQNGQFVDEATVLYFHEDARAGSDPYDSEKLWPIFQLGPEQPRASILYFLSDRQDGQHFLAQDARPFNPESEFEIRLGHTTLNTGGSFTINWPELNNIPDMWTLTLVDHVTGMTVDMKQESNYHFESSAFTPEEYEFSGETGIYPVRNLPTDHRFSIQVNPDPMKAIPEEDQEEGQPDKVELYQNFPNPFNPATNIKFYLPEQRHVNVGVYNIVGQRVALLLDEALQEGEHTLTWDASDMPSGLYIVQLELGNRVLTRKMTLIK